MEHTEIRRVTACVQATACSNPRGKFVEGVEVYLRKRLHAGARSDDPRGERAPALEWNQATSTGSNRLLAEPQL